MKSNITNNEPGHTTDFFDSLQDNGQNQRVVPPLSIWQKFWHNTKLRVVVGIVLLLTVVGGGASYFFYVRQSSSLVLTDYVPGSAWLYLEFNFDAQQWQQLQNEVPQLSQQANDFFIAQGLSQELINLSSRIALVGSLEGGELAWSWLLKASQPRQLEAFLEPGTYLRQPGTQVAVISTHQQAAKRFNYRPGRAPIYPDNTYLWHGFVKPDELADYFTRASERSVGTHLLVQWLQQYDQPVPLTIANQDDFILLSLGEMSESNVVWPEFISEHDLVLRNINITNAISELESAINRLPLVQFLWQSMKERSAANLALNWHTLQDQLDQPATVAITGRVDWSDYDSLQELPLNIDDYEFIVSLSENIPTTERFVTDLIRHYMAYRFPSEVERTLPDGVVVYDLIVDFKQHEFITDPLRKDWRTISYLDGQNGFAMWSTNENLTVTNQVEASALRLSNIQESEFACGNLAGEQIYIGPNLLRLLPFSQDLSDVLISASSRGLGVCLR